MRSLQSIVIEKVDSQNRCVDFIQQIPASRENSQMLVELGSLVPLIASACRIYNIRIITCGKKKPKKKEISYCDVCMFVMVEQRGRIRLGTHIVYSYTIIVYGMVEIFIGSHNMYLVIYRGTVGVRYAL